MSKITLGSTVGGLNITTINDNFTKIEDALNDQVLFRDHESGEPNAMNANLDMNGFLILNCPNLGTGGGGSGGGTIGDGTGGTGTDGYSNALVYAYQRSATIPSGSPGTVTYDFSTHTIVFPVEALENGWSRIITEGNDPLWVTVATANNRVITDIINTNEWSSPVVLVKDGVSSLNTAPVYLYQRSPTPVPPALPSTAVTYIFSTGVSTGVNNGWTSTIPPDFGGPYLWVTTATAVSAENTDTIAPSEWAVGQLMAQDGLDGTNGGADGLNNGTFYAYKRSTTVPTTNPGPVTYHFASASITTPSTDALANEWFKSPPSGTAQMYVCVASASSDQPTDDIAATEWTAPAVLGTNGLNTATLYVYRRTASATAPTGPTANVGYDFTNKLITGLTNSWSAQLPPATGGMYLWVTTATAASATGTDTIPPGEWATPQQLAKDGITGTNGTNGANGTDGTRGTVAIAYLITGTTWSSATANLAISSSGYGAPQNRDIVTLYNAAGTFTQTRFYTSGVWNILTSYIDGNLLVTGTIAAEKINGGILDGVQFQAGTGHTPSGRAFEVTSSGVVWADNIFGGTIYGDNYYSSSSNGVTGVSNWSARDGVLGSGAAGTTATGVRGICSNGSTSGLVGAGNGYDFYANGGGTNYGPFTGSHDGLVVPGDVGQLGDILVDVACVCRSNISNTIFEVKTSSEAYQPAVGVLARQNGPLDEAIVPAAFLSDEMGTDNQRIPRSEYNDALQVGYQLIAMNSLGEGQINVCGQNGDIKNGDFIITSTIPGKGMKQIDDTLRTYTVAKAREAVTFSSPNEVKTIACIYVCG